MRRQPAKDSVTGSEVDEDDEVKGYKRGEDEYVMLGDDEIDAVSLESTRTIDIADNMGCKLEHLVRDVELGHTTEGIQAERI